MEKVENREREERGKGRGRGKGEGGKEGLQFFCNACASGYIWCDND